MVGHIVRTQIMHVFTIYVSSRDSTDVSSNSFSAVQTLHGAVLQNEGKREK